MRVLLLSLLLLFAGMATASADNAITVYGGGPIAAGESRQLTAYVPLSPNTVTFSVNGVQGGTPTYGTVSATGLYRAPAVIPQQNSVVVTATSTAYPDKSGSATLIVGQSQVQLWSASPTTVSGAFKLSLNGANFNPQSQVKFGDTLLTTQYVSPTSLIATGTATAAQAGTKVRVVVINPGLGGTTSSAISVSVSSGSTTTPPPPTPTSPAVTLTPASATLKPNGTQQFTATVTGATNTAITYSVNGTPGGNASVGTVTANGLYTAPATAVPTAITISVATVATPVATATASVTVQNPNPGMGLGTANLAAARFLEQATFGPTPADILSVKQNGVAAWLNDQFAMAETPVPNPGAMNSGTVQQQYLSRMTAAPDQLRQRVAYALGSFIVISMNKNIYPDQIVPYLQILSHDAFGNYRALLGDISVSSQMGKYLDLAGSHKPGAGGGANENYAREVMQLFSIGLVQLNPDGTPVLDAQGKTIPTYDQTTVQQVALALTGWVYHNNAYEDFSGPLEPMDANHDMHAKTFLGCQLPANQTTAQDMSATLDCVFNHPNVGPFVATRLIRQMVTSNPSPAYVGRVAAVFNDNGSGVRGDLKAVVTAILTDTEARNDTPAPNAGRLRDPMQHIAAFVRVMNGTISPVNGLPWEFSQMTQAPLTPPSVFGFYAPGYHIPKSALSGPEFQIYTPTESVFRGNMIWQIISNPASDFTIDLSAFAGDANNTIALIDRVDQTLFYGRMPPELRQSLANAITAQSDSASRWQAALYLAALSGFYATQY